ncbi:carbohydrate ABC transporter permease [Micromonospora sediminicola]|uniref:carbohydrate ABC transporter permease n=1 Tax=Micromonospora sediminicola TaxID=946078 RepID=UPI00378A3C2B
MYSAFTDTALSGAGAAQSRFVGLDNFRHAFASADFRNAVVLTLVFTVLSAIVGQNVLGLLLALLMRVGSKPVRAAVGAVVVGAWVLPEIVAAYLWTAFLGPQGSLNVALGHLGIGPQTWLYSSPILAVSLANVWRGTAFSMLVYSAALSEVPVELEEAAEVDGAGRLRRLWSVTLPLIRRAVATNLMLITLQTLAVFGLIYACAVHQGRARCPTGRRGCA